MGDASLPWFRARRLEVAGVDVLAMRLSFTGELAWELHAPNDRLGELWDALMTAGAEHGVAWTRRRSSPGASRINNTRSTFLTLQNRLNLKNKPIISNEER